MTMKNIKPLGNRVLIKRFHAPTLKGNILLPDAAQEKPKTGEVLAVGEGKFDEKGNLEKMNLKIGDQVLFSSYGGIDVPSDDENEYMILSDDDILAIIEK